MSGRGDLTGVADDEALAWIVRLNGAPTTADRAAFDAWRRAPGHDTAFARAEALWRRTEVPAHLLALEAVDLPQILPRERTHRHRAVRLWMAAVAMILLLVAGAAILDRPHLVQNAFADVVSPRGDRQQIELPDGSAALLDADTALDLRFDGKVRRLRLLRGTAFFQVRPDALPFVVEAAGGEARVLGTSFTVGLLDQGVTVTVATGRVEVRAPGGTAATLTRGQRLRYGPGGAGGMEIVDLEEALAWREGRLVFRQAPLREVVMAIERYRSGRILILDDELAARRVTGSFAAGNPEAALASLRSILGFQRQDLLGRYTLLR